MTRFVASLLAAALPAAALAQGVPQTAPPMPPQVPLGAPRMTAPVPAPAPVVPRAQPLPQVSDAQAAELARLLGRGAVAQGLAQAAPPTPAEREALVRAALDQARAIHAGRLDTADFRADWGLRPARFDPLPGFADAVARDRIAAWFASLPPPYAGYDGLQKGLERYRRIAADGGWHTLAAGADLGLGAKGAAVAALRRRLAMEDDTVAREGATYDKPLQAAVQRAQRRYGLNPTGVVSTQTRTALNVSAEARVRQIMANMERWRWLPQQLPENRIQVNIAAAVLTVFEGDRPIMSMRGVTGRPGDETPMLQSSIHSIVVNPPWNVPAGIARRELFPKGAAYLKANAFRVIGEGENRRLQQAAGPKSALGRYKFDFDNPYAVYLHDTPSQATFARFDRLASHGCVRVERPADLAALLLRDDPAWGADALKAAVAAGKTQRVRLPGEVAVYLLYWTAFASGDGTMNFRADPYGWDGQLAAKIEARSAAQALAAR